MPDRQSKKFICERGFLMKKNIGKVIALAMAAVMTFSVSPALKADAATKNLAAKTVYLESEYSSESISIQADKATTVKNLKSTNKTAVKPSSYSLSQSTTVDENGKDKSTSRYGYAYFSAVKPGTATVSFTAGSTTYKQKINVKKYVNPLKSVKINKAELAGMLKNSAYGASTTAAKTIKVNATAASGWKIQNISVFNSLNDGYLDAYRSYNKGASKGSLSFSGYNVKQYGSVGISLKNTKDGGEIRVSISLRQATK